MECCNNKPYWVSGLWLDPLRRRISRCFFFFFAFFFWSLASWCKWVTQPGRRGLEVTWRHLSETTYNSRMEQRWEWAEGSDQTQSIRDRPPVSSRHLGVCHHPRCFGVCWFHVNRPIRVSLADRKECRTNTTGFGPEWRSKTWRRKGSRVGSIWRSVVNKTEQRFSCFPRYSHSSKKHKCKYLFCIFPKCFEFQKVKSLLLWLTQQHCVSVLHLLTDVAFLWAVQAEPLWRDL